MYFGKFKTIVIVFLVILAVYQTGVLWLTSSSGDGPLSLIAKNINNMDTEKKIIDSIDNIFINTGDAKLIKKYNSLTDLGYKRVVDDAIAYSMKKGRISRIKDFNIKDVLYKKGIIYTYAYDVIGDDISKIFNIKGDISKVTSFNNIAILPIEKGDGIETILFNTKTLSAYKIIVNKKSLEININNVINEISKDKKFEHYYTFVSNSTNRIFTGSSLLPISKNNKIFIDNIKAINPLEKDGGILLSGSEEYIDIFFPNPAIKVSTFINDTYTYSDENIVVKYYTNGVLEYTNYTGAIKENNKSPYDITKDFLKNDINIKNDYYLKDYVLEDDKVMFKFDYKIDTIPIRLSHSQKNYTGLDAMIEVTVENGRVSKYKRVIYDFYQEYVGIDINVDYRKIIPNFLQKYNEKTIKNIEFIYRFNKIGEPISSGFNIKSDEKMYFEKASFKEGA